jgi:hypothetical protein
LMMKLAGIGPRGMVGEGRLVGGGFGFGFDLRLSVVGLWRLVAVEKHCLYVVAVQAKLDHHSQ